MRKIFLVLITLWLIIPAIHAQKVGLVLSGGGAKGMTHIGIIRALEENNIPIDYIAGTSMGAIIGSLYAMGYSPDKDSHIVLRASIKEVKRNIVIVEAKLYNKDGEVCTESVCTYFTFSKEKSKDEMHFSKCDVESEEILPLI